MLKVFVVDDEPLARDELKYMLRRSKQTKIVGEADCLEEAYKQIMLLEPDLVFLDIQLSEDSGLDLAEQLREMEKTPAIVFATAYDEYALRAFELNALDYVLKPFEEERIAQTLDKIAKLKQLGEKEAPAAPKVESLPTKRVGKLAITTEERILLLDMENIICVGLEGGKTVVKTLESAYKARDSLVVIEKKLPAQMFMRVHRSFLVNVHHIMEVQPWFNSTYNLIMKDKSKIPVSRTYVKELKRFLGL
ncbi:MAG: LytR/AlgR family response regulator transcription factor [Ectobacillus sp.]